MRRIRNNVYRAQLSPIDTSIFFSMFSLLKLLERLDAHGILFPVYIKDHVIIWCRLSFVFSEIFSFYFFFFFFTFSLTKNLLVFFSFLPVSIITQAVKCICLLNRVAFPFSFMFPSRLKVMLECKLIIHHINQHF